MYDVGIEAIERLIKRVDHDTDRKIDTEELAVEVTIIRIREHPFHFLKPEPFSPPFSLSGMPEPFSFYR